MTIKRRSFIYFVIPGVPAVLLCGGKWDRHGSKTQTASIPGCGDMIFEMCGSAVKYHHPGGKV